jgi:hypothetical protein
MFDAAFWKSNRERFAASYRHAAATAQATAYAAMVDFQVLTADRDVQRSLFSNGLQVTVNFGNGTILPPGGCILRN